ncbi:MAG: NAD-dependent epimerase/dehydratase family protein, partial [Gammaproteobacteria bacterium]
MKNKKNIVLVGANGLFGSSFVKLYDMQYNILEITRENCQQILESMKNEKDSFYDAVIFAAQSSDYKSNVFSNDIFDINLRLFHQILNIFQKKTNKIVFFSTGSVYKSDENEVITENTALDYHSKNPYVLSKLSAELILQSYQGIYQSITILRPFYMYGENQNELMLFMQIVQKLKNDMPIEINCDGGMKFNCIHADDVSLIVAKILE